MHNDYFDQTHGYGFLQTKCREVKNCYRISTKGLMIETTSFYRCLEMLRDPNINCGFNDYFGFAVKNLKLYVMF